MSTIKETRQIPVDSDDSDDELPPLEDMSTLVNHIKQAKPVKLAEPEKKVVEEKPVPKTIPATPSVTEPKKTGTIKRGFFSKAAKSDSTKPAAKKTEPVKKVDDIPLIAPTNPGANSLKMDDVQKAMGAVNWTAPDFMQAMTMRSELVQGMNDPRMMQAVGEFAKDGRAAMEKYKDDEDVKKFLLSFADLMGTHMSKLGEEQNKAQQSAAKQARETFNPTQQKFVVEMESAEEKRKREQQELAAKPKIEELDDDGNPLNPAPQYGPGGAVMEHPDPRVRDALADEGVRKVLDLLRQGVPVELGEVAAKQPQVAMKLKILLDSGLLNGQKEPPK